MKSKKKQRILALILSMVLMLSASISALAEGDVQTEASGTETTENQAAVQSLEQETVPETEVTTEEGGIDTQSAETSTEPVQENTEQEVTETPAEPEQGVTEETAETTDTTQSQAQSTEVQEESDAAEEIPVEEQPGETTEETATEETVVSEAAELKQEFTDENGNVTQTVTAYVPEGAFQATADQISMEVSLLNTDDTNYIKGMMEELLPENHYLGGYVLYQIDFKVNGEITQPAKAITITMNGNDLAVEDTQKAHVFYYDSEDPEVEGDKDQLIEVTQKDQLLKSLEESGQSTENIEDYDYSEITVNEGNADTITVKGWNSTIYGCYVEKEAVTELTYEDDSVTVSVSADEAGIIPDGAELSVTPITKTEITDDMSEEEKAQAEEINAQYDFTEEQLQKDSEENATTMEGFLAYDICFLVDGVEVEPSGDVKVIMAFKEAAVPEGVSEDAEVTVKHLKEDESAEDGVVVEDMTESASVETTENVAVQKVELTAESFSVFTVQWTYKNEHYSSGDIDINVVDENGRPLSVYNESFRDDNLNATVEEIAEHITIDEVGNYRFLYASISNINGTKISHLGIDDSNKVYREQGSNEWQRIGNRTIYFVFGEIEAPGTIFTADTDDVIDLNLFDYVVGQPDEYNERNQEDNDWAGDNTGINANHAFKFQSNSGGRTDKINQSGSPNQGIVKNKLGSDGFPVLNISGSDEDNSLAYLFDDSTANYKSAYVGLNKLFTYDDSTRAYSYNSDTNYAYFDTANNNKDFVVYEDPVNIGGYHGFFPFSKYEAVEGTSRGPKTGVDLDCDNRQNHYFGMTMTTTFMQPKDGKISENDPMIFSFSGDDDVWVYVDGVLVMDIGGTHNAVSGSINFSTGEINVAGKTTYIGDILRNNGISESKLDGNTLKDYEEFELKFFYLERGNYDSNCKLEFNLAMINKNSVSVGKEITDVDTSKYEDIEFEYLIEVGEDSDSLEPYANQRYKIYNLDDRSYTGETGVTDTEGHFYLKHNQLAVFEEDENEGTNGIDENLYYQVTELNVNSQEYNYIIINQTDIVSIGFDETVSNDGTITGNEENKVYSASSPIYQVSETGRVIFYNRCSAYNKRELHIEKEMQTGQTSSETFSMQVTLDGELYDGGYILIGTDGSRENKNAVSGIIQLKVGEEAVISEIPADTTFEIVEQTESLPTEYKEPQYQVINGGSSVDTEGKAAGQIVSGQDAKVTVTNSYTAPDALFIEIQKTFSGLEELSDEEWNNLKENFKIYLYDETGTQLLKTLTLNDSDCVQIEDTYSWRVEISSTDIDGSSLTYQIQEEGATVEGYELTVTVNGQKITANQKVPVTVTNPEFTIINGENGRYFIEKNSCSSLTFNFETNFIAGRLKRNEDQNYIVWTREELSATERAALVSLIMLHENAGQDWNDMSVASTLFYSDEGDSSIREGISVGGDIIRLDENNTLIFSGTSQWQKVCGGFYEKTDGQDAEIAIANTYNPETVTIDLQKYGTDYSTEQISGAIFALYKGEKSGQNIQWDTSAPYKENIGVSKDNLKELELEPGYYYLEETTAPEGYQILGENIYFFIDSDGLLSLINESGTSYDSSEENAMWRIPEGTNNTIQIKNKTLYSLPSSGGPGIFLYMIGGTLFMIAGSLMIYINRRKGVLRR